MTGRPPSNFKIETIPFRNGEMVADFPDEPRESASFWHKVADSQRVRLDKAVDANKALRQALLRAESKLDQLKAQSPERK